MPGRPRSSPASTPNQPQVQIPKLNKDPIWSLQPWSAVITVGGEEFTIPAVPAVEWLSVLMADQFDAMDLLDEFLAGDEVDRVNDLLISGEVTVVELHETILDLIATVSARKWWVTLRLISVVRSDWAILGGELLLKGVDATTLSLAAWLDVLTLIAIRLMQPDKVSMFTAQLEMPPPEAVSKEMETQEEEEGMDPNAFLAMGR